MLEYIEYAVTWLFFMAIIAGICILVPKIAPKIGKLFKGNKNFKNPYDFGDDQPKTDDTKSFDDGEEKKSE